MGFGYAVVSGAQVNAGGDPTPKMQPGTLMAYKDGDQWSIVQYVLADNNGWSLGEALVKSYATAKHYCVKKAATIDNGAPLGGIALSTVASNRYGWMVVHGYVEKAYVSEEAAPGEYLCIGASTAGQLTSDKASTFNRASAWAGSSFLVVGAANATVAGGALGSITLLGFWGV